MEGIRLLRCLVNSEQYWGMLTLHSNCANPGSERYRVSWHGKSSASAILNKSWSPSAVSQSLKVFASPTDAAICEHVAGPLSSLVTCSVHAGHSWCP